MTGTWIKISDQVTEHPQMAELSPYAWTLWLHGLTYSSRNLTDGFIPRAMLPRLAGIRSSARAAEELVQAGCWSVTEKGWEVVNYAKHQRTKTQVEADRADAAERKRRSRSTKRKEPPDVTNLSQRDTPVTNIDVTPLESESESDISLSPPEPESYPQKPPERETGTATLSLIDQVAAFLGEHDWQQACEVGLHINNHRAYRQSCVDRRRSDPFLIDHIEASANLGLTAEELGQIILDAEQPRHSTAPPALTHLPGTGFLDPTPVEERWEETPDGMRRRKAAS